MCWYTFASYSILGEHIPFLLYCCDTVFLLFLEIMDHPPPPPHSSPYSGPVLTWQYESWQPSVESQYYF